MINQIELSKKFEEIFVDEETFDFFIEWHEEKEKKEDTRTWFQKYWPPLVFAIIGAGVITWITWFTTKTEVVQEVYDRKNGETSFATWVYYKGKLIEGYFVSISELTDSIKQRHKEDGEQLLRTLDK